MLADPDLDKTVETLLPGLHKNFQEAVEKQRADPNSRVHYNSRRLITDPAELKQIDGIARLIEEEIS
jgi:hypothetical protein